MTLAAALTPFDSTTLGWVLLLPAAASMLGVTTRAAPLPRPAWGLLLVGAITLRHDPVFWRSVDGGTAGPLNYYPLLPAARADGLAAHAVARGIGLAAVLAKALLTDEPLAIWGWRSSLCVDASRPQATRQAHSENQIYPGALQAYFLRRYLGDFQASDPPVFVDAAGPGNLAFGDRDRAPKSFPPLRAWIAAHSTPVADLGGSRLCARNALITRTAGPSPRSRRRFSKSTPCRHYSP